MQSEIVWEFSTEQFTVVLEAYPETNLDLSWDIDGSIAEGIERGELRAFCARVSVVHRGMTLAEDHIGNCVYDAPAAFRHHSGYFRDMVRNVCRNARQAIRNVPRVRAA